MEDYLDCSHLYLYEFYVVKLQEDVMSVLTGLMIGSLATLWPWKESYDTKGVSLIWV